ncbi:Crp/Fnr family transcriptional regulator [Paraflavitalea soli]|uniref:Crp/Fnr family transcriptional regulator n=1 Tax=Paraflavitalea soli TaxID=2315862 RepID=A0A3B7MJ95_9BACT|nr:Crp/Fnr family transcriptional regulator [Paraflavitalea soli]AXY74524.1 Crp/Fnr family transcriptional regulator [Paraflavitalea soli]
MYEVFKQYIKDKVSITDEEFALIQSLGTLKKLQKKQFLLHEGMVWKYNAFVCKGCLRTYRIDDKGNEHILQFSIENWWAGDRESLITGNPAQSNIEALEDSVILLFTQEQFATICKEIPAFNSMVINILEKSFIAAQNRIHASISYSTEEKYQNFLHSYPGIANRVPQHMIASYLGVTAETLSRLRNQATKK